MIITWRADVVKIHEAQLVMNSRRARQAQVVLQPPLYD